MKELENNPHALQVVEELVKDLALLKRVEAGDMEAVSIASERAKEHFELISLGVHGNFYKKDIHEALISEMSYRVYNQIKGKHND